MMTEIIKIMGTIIKIKTKFWCPVFLKNCNISQKTLPQKGGSGFQNWNSKPLVNRWNPPNPSSVLSSGTLYLTMRSCTTILSVGSMLKIIKVSIVKNQSIPGPWHSAAAPICPTSIYCKEVQLMHKINTFTFTKCTKLHFQRGTTFLFQKISLFFEICNILGNPPWYTLNAANPQNYHCLPFLLHPCRCCCFWYTFPTFPFSLLCCCIHSVTAAADKHVRTLPSSYFVAADLDFLIFAAATLQCWQS